MSIVDCLNYRLSIVAVRLAGCSRTKAGRWVGQTVAVVVDRLAIIGALFLSELPDCLSRYLSEWNWELLELQRDRYNLARGAAVAAATSFASSGWQPFFLVVVVVAKLLACFPLVILAALFLFIICYLCICAI